ncbi:MAG: hypothetical protein IKB55_02360 [Clostridia bacterium]|nr:hypothetical protein [Clostridia bacterium]
MSNGKKTWYIADGYLPHKGEVKDSGFEGHESIMFMNCNEQDANVFIDLYFEDKPPIKDIKLVVGAERVKSIRLDNPDDIGGVKLDRQYQYSVRIRSDINIVVQYGRMDLAQPNLAYMSLMGYSE